MRPLKLEQSDTLNSNKTENETTKARTMYLIVLVLVVSNTRLPKLEGGGSYI